MISSQWIVIVSVGRFAGAAPPGLAVADLTRPLKRTAPVRDCRVNDIEFRKETAQTLEATQPTRRRSRNHKALEPSGCDQRVEAGERESVDPDVSGLVGAGVLQGDRGRTLTSVPSFLAGALLASSTTTS